MSRYHEFDGRSLQASGVEFGRQALVNVRAETFYLREFLPSTLPPPGIEYKTTSGEVFLSDSGKKRATMGFVAHRATQRERQFQPDRPTYFFWNGGPITPATTWSDQSFGPWVMSHPPDSQTANPGLERNAASPLLWGDVVSVDPVGTGPGAVLPGQDQDHYYGVQRDVEAARSFVEWYIDQFECKENPIILVGSSYGAFRVTGVARELHKSGIKVSALAFLSGHYDYSLKDYEQSEDSRPFTSSLPVMALVSQFHGRLNRRTPPHILYDEVDRFAKSDYLKALTTEHLSQEQRNGIVERLATYTGLPADLIERSDLRISPQTFGEELLRDRGLELSMLDGRVTCPRGAPVTIDRALDEREAKRIAARNLGNFHPQSVYQGTKSVLGEWDFTGIWKERRVHEAMIDLLRENPNLRILHAAGMYDLNTPPACSEIFWEGIQDETGIDIRRDHSSQSLLSYRETPGVHIATFPTGHQMGVDEYSRLQLGTALRSLTRMLRK